MSGNGGKSYAEKYANRRTDYNMRSNDKDDLANLATYDNYLDSMSEVFERCYRLLQPGRYMAVIVRNAYQHGEYMFTHVDLKASRLRRMYSQRRDHLVSGWHKAQAVWLPF